MHKLSNVTSPSRSGIPEYLVRTCNLCRQAVSQNIHGVSFRANHATSLNCRTLEAQ